MTFRAGRSSRRGIGACNCLQLCSVEDGALLDRLIASVRIWWCCQDRRLRGREAPAGVLHNMGGVVEGQAVVAGGGLPVLSPRLDWCDVGVYPAVTAAAG